MGTRLKVDIGSEEALEHVHQVAGYRRGIFLGGLCTWRGKYKTPHAISLFLKEKKNLLFSIRFTNKPYLLNFGCYINLSILLCSARDAIEDPNSLGKAAGY